MESNVCYILLVLADLPRCRILIPELCPLMLMMDASFCVQQISVSTRQEAVLLVGTLALAIATCIK